MVGPGATDQHSRHVSSGAAWAATERAAPAVADRDLGHELSRPASRSEHHSVRHTSRQLVRARELAVVPEGIGVPIRGGCVPQSAVELCGRRRHAPRDWRLRCASVARGTTDAHRKHLFDRPVEAGGGRRGAGSMVCVTSSVPSVGFWTMGRACPIVGPCSVLSDPRWPDRRMRHPGRRIRLSPEATSRPGAGLAGLDRGGSARARHTTPGRTPLGCLAHLSRTDRH